MSVTSASDFRGYMADWGESWTWRGRAFLGDFSNAAGSLGVVGSHGVRGTVPTIRILVSDELQLEVGEIIVRGADGKAYTIRDLYKDNDAFAAPAWRCRLTEC